MGIELMRSSMMRVSPIRASIGLALTLLVTTTACAYHDDRPGTVHLADPGACVAVDVAATPDTAPLLEHAASNFNGSADARARDGACTFVRVHSVDSPVALRQLEHGWPDSAELGPAPTLWVPGSTTWGELLNARLARSHRRAIAPNGAPFARSPLVVAMPAVMARALDYPRRPIAWTDLERLARDPRGWAAYGHREWGPFRIGKGNPNWSTTGLDEVVAVDASPSAAADAPVLESAVRYYGDTTAGYFENWRRIAAKSRARALTYLSAAITDERAVVAYNSGHQPDDVALTGAATRPALPLVAVYPEATIESDNPLIVLDAPWTTPAARQGARLFATFARGRATQQAVAAAGYRPVRGPVRADLLDAANGVDASARPTAVAPASPAMIEQALTRWQAARRHARVLFVFDESASMGDAADPTLDHGPTKLALARVALSSALPELAPGDEIGLRVFSTDLGPRANPAATKWRDVVPMGPLSQRRAALSRTIAALQPRKGSPLYVATHDAFDAVAARADTRAIDAVVVLTDGYDEDDNGISKDALLASLATKPDVSVFTVAFGGGADFDTLQKIADATDARVFDAREPKDLADLLPRALAGL
jgi:Ca-activated chloride channel family protein